MKYAIYDNAADAYLTKMVFDVGYSDNAQFECALTEYITKAHLFDTKKAANDAVARIESSKFMEEGRFVVHSFDDALAAQYIISEAGNPTKVVDNITVDLSGAINVKYGTMPTHWSTMSLADAVNRMFKLQNAASEIYAPWHDTFDIYKAVPVIDEREYTHYQFIKATEKGLDSAKEENTASLNKRIEELEKKNSVLTEDVKYHNECRLALAEIIRSIKYAIYSKDSDKRDNYISYMTDRIKNDEFFNRPELKTTKNDIPKICTHLTALPKDSLNKRIEDLEKANYDLGEQVTARGAVANRLQEENDKLKAAVESIKEEARNWKTMYKSEAETLDILKDVVDTIYTDLQSVTACDDLEGTLKALSHNSDLDHIFMPTKTSYVLDKGNCLTAKDEIYYIVNQIITILESRELNQEVAFLSAEEVDRAKKLANDIIDICEATTDPFELTLEKFSQLYEAVNDPKDDDDTIMYALKSVLAIFSALEDKVRNIIDESVTWKHKAMKAEKALDNQKKLNEANVDTIEHMRTAGADWKRRAEEAINDYRKCNEALGEWKKKCRAKDADYEILKNKLKACEIILESTQSSLTATIKERDKALEQKEFYKRQANSVYGMTVPCRCNGKQMFYDVITGKKILVDKEKYDDLIKWLDTINFSYDTMTFINPKPTWLPLVSDYLKDLTT